jgi:hypothetical protein
MELMKIQKVLYKAFVLVNLVIAIYFMLYTINLSRGYELWDFQVFYGAIRNVIAGSSIYTRYGAAILPFWYFPWVSWLFLPLAFFPFEIASYLFLAAGLTITALVIHFLAKHYQSFDIFDRVYMFSMVIWLSWLVYRVGQMSYFVLGGAVLVMFLLARQRNYLAGLCIPLHYFSSAGFMDGWVENISGGNGRHLGPFRDRVSDHAGLGQANAHFAHPRGRQHGCESFL